MTAYSEQLPRQSQHYAALQASEAKSVPGKAHEDAQKMLRAFNTTAALQEAMQQLAGADAYLNERAQELGLADGNAKMFDYFLSHNPLQFTDCVVCDWPESLEGVKKVNQTHAKRVRLATVPVLKDGKPLDAVAALKAITDAGIAKPEAGDKLNALLAALPSVEEGSPLGAAMVVPIADLVPLEEAEASGLLNSGEAKASPVTAGSMAVPPPEALAPVSAAPAASVAPTLQQATIPAVTAGPPLCHHPRRQILQR